MKRVMIVGPCGAGKSTLGFMLAAAGVLAFLCAPHANATMQIKLTNGASSVTITDGGAGDSCAIANCVTFNGTLGNYLINVSTGLTNNFNPFTIVVVEHDISYREFVSIFCDIPFRNIFRCGRAGTRGMNLEL